MSKRKTFWIFRIRERAEEILAWSMPRRHSTRAVREWLYMKWQRERRRRDADHR